MAIPVVLTGIYFGIKPMLIGFAIVALIYYLINVHYSAKLIHYTMKEQLTDLLPIFLVSGSISLVLYGINFLGLNYWFTFGLQAIFGFGLTMLIYNLIRFPEYINIQSKIISFARQRIG
jgi:hypothetical protein